MTATEALEISGPVAGHDAEFLQSAERNVQ